jgi:hypothetical protein
LLTPILASQEAQSEEVQNALLNLKRNEKVRLTTIKNAEAQIVAAKEEMKTEVGYVPAFFSVPTT